MPKLLVRSFIVAFVFSLTAFFITVQSAQAAPANPDPFPLTQPDGTTISAHQWGDEWNNGIETADGYAIVQDPATGYWVYAASADSSALSPAFESGHLLVVGKDEPPGLSRGIRPGVLRQNQNMELVSPITPLNQNFGAQKVLLLLVDFPDQPATYDASLFSALFFGATESVKSFYEQASRDNFTLSPADETFFTANDGVIGWLRMPYNHIDTRGNLTTANLQLVKDALIAADPYIDYASYDTDKNGRISVTELHIIVIVAGYEASYNSSTPSVWGHRSSLYSPVTPPVLDKVTLANGAYNGGYAQFGEKHGSHIATIGIMAHELGHDISWPDLYDTSYVTEGVGEWSIMGSGSWNFISGNPGNSPALPDAWLRWYQGWQAPVQIKGLNSAVTLDPIETAGSTYLLGVNPGDVDWNFTVKSGVGEYFLVENRQLIGYDRGLPGCGLLVWHIDESKTYTNSANQGTHPLVFLEQADGLNHLMSGANRGDSGDTFPGSLNKTEFNNLSTPNSNFYSGTASGSGVLSITSLPPACSSAAPSSIQSTLFAPGIGTGFSVFIAAIKTPPAPPNRGIYGIVTDHGAPVSGVQLRLRFYNGYAWSTAATTTTLADGSYSFQNPGNLTAGQAYYVLFPNVENVITRLFYWSTKAILTYTNDQEVNIGNFDVADIILGNPPHLTSTQFPVTFNWTLRTSSLTDSYHLVMYRDSDWTFFYDSGALGYISNKTLSGLPAGMSFNIIYGWFPAIEAPDGAYGESYYYNAITFLSTPSAPLGSWTEMKVPRPRQNLVYRNER